MADTGAARTVEAIFRAESARIVAGLLRRVRDVDLAEELAQDAFLAALEQWPRDGVPHNPGAWLTAFAQRRAVDRARRDATLADRRAELERELEHEHAVQKGEDPAAAAEDEIQDDLLRLAFLCCHPVLPHEGRTALVLRLFAGLSTAEIARAYLLPEPAIAQRVVRAKRALAEHGVALDLPGRAGLAERLDAVLEVVYLIFNEGYTGTAGAEWVRADLCEEALRLARTLATISADEPEAHGLAALLELQAARLPARRGDAGEPLLLADQDRGRWSRVLIERGLAALARAEASPRPPGRYALQAAIAACHARAPSAAATDWPRIVELYGALLAVAPSPVVELNRAVAVAAAFGPEAGLLLVERAAAGGELDAYHLLPSVRADLLARLGRDAEARAEWRRAAELTRNQAERALLLRRAAGG